MTTKTPQYHEEEHGTLASLAMQSYQNPHSRWTAVSQRDPAAHCQFIYGVKSTRIYCRPTCTARLARRANVVYFETADEAQREGYRPCQKCKPDDLGFVGQREQIVLSALDLLRARKDDVSLKWGLRALSKQVGVTPSYLCRAFKKTMGVTIGEYTKQFEMQQASLTALENPEPPSLAGLETASSEMPSLQPATACWDLPKAADSSLLPSNTEDTNLTNGSSSSVISKSPALASESSPEAQIQSTSPSSICSEDILDLDFNFDEWVWTEGLPSTAGL